MYKTMINLGCKPSHKGFKYIEMGVQLIRSNENVAIGEIYHQIAKAYNITYSRAERAIRHCIQSAVAIGDMDLWSEIFGYSINPYKGHATNGEFMHALARYLSLHEVSGNAWIATITYDCGVTTKDVLVGGATYTDALINALSLFDGNEAIKDPVKGVIGLRPLKGSEK